jgi:hypothetical protein
MDTSAINGGDPLPCLITREYPEKSTCLPVLETIKSQAWLATSTVSTWFDISWQCTSATPDAWLSTFNQFFKGNLHLAKLNNQ